MLLGVHRIQAKSLVVPNREPSLPAIAPRARVESLREAERFALIEVGAPAREIAGPPSPPRRYRMRGATAAHDGFFEFVPAAAADGSLPVAVIFLHGLGERGDGIDDLSRLLRNGPPALIQAGQWPGQHSAAVFAPQNPGPERCHHPDRVREFVRYIHENYREQVNVEHIVLAGYSCGGHAVWNYLGRYIDDADALGVVSAMAVSGSPLRNAAGGHPEPGEPTALELLSSRQQRVPMRIAFDFSDSVVSAEESYPMALLEEAGIEVRVDRLDGLGHGTSTPYFGRDEVLAWILDPPATEPSLALSAIR